MYPEKKMKWRVKLRILIEMPIFTLFCTVFRVAALCDEAHEADFTISRSTGASKHHFALYTVHNLCDVFVRFHRFAVCVCVSFFACGKQLRHCARVWWFSFVCVCRRVFLHVFGSFEPCICCCCLKLCRLLACCHRRHHRFAVVCFFLCLWILHIKYSSTPNKTIGTKHTIADGTSEYMELPYFQHTHTNTSKRWTSNLLCALNHLHVRCWWQHDDETDCHWCSATNCAVSLPLFLLIHLLLPFFSPFAHLPFGTNRNFIHFPLRFIVWWSNECHTKMDTFFDEQISSRIYANLIKF